MLGANDYPQYATTYDPYGYASKQCASFANWRCMHDFHLPAIHGPHGNDGGQFATTLRDVYGIPADTTPQVGDVMSFPAGVQHTSIYGHVAIVLELLRPDYVLVEDYNWFGTGQYLQHGVSTSGCLFAHTLKEADDMPVLLRQGSSGAEYLLSGSLVVPIQHGPDAGALEQAGVRMANPLSDDFIRALNAEVAKQER